MFHKVLSFSKSCSKDDICTYEDIALENINGIILVKKWNHTGKKKKKREKAKHSFCDIFYIICADGWF